MEIFCQFLNLRVIVRKNQKFRKNLDIKKYETLFMTSGYSGGKFMWKDIILKTKQGFYLFIRRHGLHKNIIDVDIYYKQEQHNELLIFIKPFVNLLTK